MPLNKQVIKVQLGDGLDTKTDPKQVVAGKMLTLENVSLQKIGRYNKRNGFTQLGSYGAPASAFVTRENDLLAFGSGAVKKYNTTNGQFVNQNITQSNPGPLSFDPCTISSSSSITGTKKHFIF